MASSRLRKLLADQNFFTAPGVFDCMSAKLANAHGFDVIYYSGYWMTASRTGMADVGLATLSEFVDGIRAVRDCGDAALIADADTGFGGLLNIRRTTQEYERAGVAAIQIEDQVFPKKCGHTPNKQVVPIQEMEDRIKVAADSRQSEDFLIIARTDARQSEGLQPAIDRAARYHVAGADLLFVEAPLGRDEMVQICQAADAPQLANVADGGVTPILDRDALIDVGYAGAIFPAAGPLAMLHALDRMYVHMKATGSSAGSGMDLFDFGEVCRMYGFEEVWAFEKKWGRYE